jgi:hypothetical protein
MNDVNVDLIGEEAIRGKECGNAITISHKRGFTTQYCHLRKNSIAVKKGEAVSKGQQIAEVGMSGLTSFPYLEFTVKSEENLVDPFTGADPVSSSPYVPCGSLDIYPLWDRDTEKKLKYLSSALLGAGFSQKPPHPNGVRAGKFNNKTLPDDTKFLIFWVDIFGIQKGDTLRILITDEEGTLLKEDLRHFKNSKTHHYQFLGTPHSNGFWPAGVYTATITLERTYFSAPENIFKETRSVTIKGTN